MSLAQMFSELDGERPLLLSVAEAHRKLGIGRTMFYAELQAGRIRSIKVGARRMVPMSALKAYVDDRLAEADE